MQRAERQRAERQRADRQGEQRSVPNPALSRRSVLRLGLSIGGVATTGLALEALAPAAAWATAALPSSTTPGHASIPVGPVQKGAGRRPRPDLPAGTDTLPQIDHVIVLMMENHSFDNYFGTLGHGDGLTMTPLGATNSNPGPDGRPVRSHHFPNTKQSTANSPQSWRQSHQQWDNGRNEGFARGALGADAMGYWTPADIPFYASLARTFTLCDRWFASALGPTHPNRRFLIAGTAGGLTHNRAAVCFDPPPATGTIFDRLDEHQISWRNYYVTAPTAALYMKSVRRPAETLVPLARYFADAAAGTLPAFSLVDPDYQHGSEELPQDISVGEAFASRVITAAMASPAWPKTLLVWCYDEHGGYYDHVPPPAAPAPDPTIAQLSPGDPRADYSRFGFRVPAVVASPYARPGAVSHQVYDHTSILAFLERKWNLPALTERDAHAADLLDCLDLAGPAFLKPPTLSAPKDPAAATKALAPRRGSTVRPGAGQPAIGLPAGGAHGPAGGVAHPGGITVPTHGGVAGPPPGGAASLSSRNVARPVGTVAPTTSSLTAQVPTGQSIGKHGANNSLIAAGDSVSENPPAALVWPELAGLSRKSDSPTFEVIGAASTGMALAGWLTRRRRLAPATEIVADAAAGPPTPPSGHGPLEEPPVTTSAGHEPGVPLGE